MSEEAPVIDLDALAQAASCLEPLPTSVTRLAAMVCGDATPDLLDVVDVVQYDEALTATLLRAANSSWSASRVAITNVRDAVVRLGGSAVFSLAMGAGVHARFVAAVPEYGLEEGDLWRHSVAASLAAELLARRTPVVLPPETMTGALLHDVGKLVMRRFLAPELLDALDAARRSGLTRSDAESEVLGVHHAELGGLILQCWSLPDRLVRAVSYHHQPELGGDAVCAGVHLADAIAKAVTAGAPVVPAGDGADDNADPHRFAGALGVLQLDAGDAPALVATTAERLDEVLARYGA